MRMRKISQNEITSGDITNLVPLFAEVVIFRHTQPIFARCYSQTNRDIGYGIVMLAAVTVCRYYLLVGLRRHARACHYVAVVTCLALLK